MIFNAMDNPDKRDYPFEDFAERASGDTERTRPKKEVIVQNQKNTPACTMYSAIHISNGQNLNEDKRLKVNRPQVDPIWPRNNFCARRGNYNSGAAIQTIANTQKKTGFIEW